MFSKKKLKKGKKGETLTKDVKEITVVSHNHKPTTYGKDAQRLMESTDICGNCSFFDIDSYCCFKNNSPASIYGKACPSFKGYSSL